MTTLRDGVSVPVMENFMSDVGDGCCLAALLSFYCPQTVKLEGKSGICRHGICFWLYHGGQSLSFIACTSGTKHSVSTFFLELQKLDNAIL